MWKDYVCIDPEDVRYLAEFCHSQNIHRYTDDELADLYMEFSEEAWAAMWEDNAEGQFCEWLYEKGYI